MVAGVVPNIGNIGRTSDQGTNYDMFYLATI
jgi:hypothetical protein